MPSEEDLGLGVAAARLLPQKDGQCLLTFTDALLAAQSTTGDMLLMDNLYLRCVGWMVCGLHIHACLLRNLGYLMHAAAVFHGSKAGRSGYHLSWTQRAYHKLMSAGIALQ